MDMSNPARSRAAQAGIAAKITRVETLPLRVPLKVPVKIAAGGARPNVEVMLVRLHSDAGVSGVGETQAWRRQGSDATLASLKSAIEGQFAPLIVGRSPFDIAPIMKSMAATSGHSRYAQAPVSDALYDLQGKLLGVPVYQLLGGRCRDKVDSCAVLYLHPGLDATLADADAIFARGFRSFAIKVGVDLKADIANVRALRERFGAEVKLRVDANGGMKFDDAAALLKAIEPYGIDAAEQLLPMWELDAMAELARQSTIPFVADECLSDERDLMEIVRRRAASGIQTKTAKNGGIWHARKLWQIADAAGLRIFPGNHPGTSIATVAVAHLATAWPGELLDGPFTVGLSALGEDIVTEPVRLDGGAVRVTDAPGLGVTLDEEKIRRLRAEV